MNYKYRILVQSRSDLTITSGRLRQRLNDLTEAEIRDVLTAKDSEIYRHYLDRTSEDKPVMYLLYPTSEESRGLLHAGIGGFVHGAECGYSAQG